MGERYVIEDDATGYRKLGPSVVDVDSYIYDDFDVGVGGQSTFILARTFTALQIMVVLVNGQEQREGVAFTRNVGAHSITFTYTVPKDAWVRTKLLNPGIIAEPSVSDFDVGAGGQTNFDPSSAFNNFQQIEMLVNGIQVREGVAYGFARNVGTQEIITNYTVPEFAWVRIRIF